MAKTSKAPAAKTFGDLSPIEWQALAIGVKDAGEFRPCLKVAEGQQVDFCVRVRGTVTVCADNVCEIPKKPKLDEVLGLALLQLGPAARLKVSDAIERAFGPDAVAPYEPTPLAVELTKNILLRITRREEQRRKGNVTGQIGVALSRKGC